MYEGKVWGSERMKEVWVMKNMALKRWRLRTQILVLRATSEKYPEKELFIGFMDLEKACDIIWRSTMFSIL